MLLVSECVEFCSEERNESVKISERKNERRDLYDMCKTGFELPSQAGFRTKDFISLNHFCRLQ